MININLIFELCVIFVITYFFIKYKKPKIKFLFYGYIFFIITLFIQIPFKFLEYIYRSYFNKGILIPFILINILIIIISEITKYFSLKRFLKTKSYKNGILFGIGWTSIESLNIFSFYFFNYFFKLFKINYSTSYNLINNSILNFGFLLIINLAITVFIVIAIIKKNKFYLIYAIFYSFLIYFGLFLFSNNLKIIFIILILIYSFYILFYYKKLK